MSTSMKIKRMTENAIEPTRGSLEAAGWDLYCTEDIELEPAATALIGTGWAMEIPKGYFGAIFARSGLALKNGLRPANCVGVVDSDYRNEIKVALHNDSQYRQFIAKGNRIAQLILIPYNTVTLEEVDSLDETERGLGGFGSTGK